MNVNTKVINCAIITLKQTAWPLPGSTLAGSEVRGFRLAQCDICADTNKGSFPRVNLNTTHLGLTGISIYNIRNVQK